MPNEKAPRDFIREIINADLGSGKHAEVVTRFPPEPNGYLHIGHAKSICLNFGLPGECGTGRCHLRFDDTNPEKEESEYVESIKEDVRWLGFDWGEHLYFASDYFGFFHDCAVHLIRQGKAYVDERSPEEIKAGRGDVVTPEKPGPFRDRPAEESLALFEKMKAGGIGEGEMVLRAKIDLASSNMNLRDPVLYRVLHAEHHNTGAEWKIYPMYDFAHPLEDAVEHVTHSLCTLEFENHRPLYDWFIEHCPVPSKPRQIEFARLNLTYTVMSKRKLLELVREGLVGGWDDPRMPTISGLRRRGFPAPAIRAFCKRIGITKQNSLTDVSLLEYEARQHLNATADRRMAVLDPLEVVLENWEEGRTEAMMVDNNPENPEAGKRGVPLGKVLWIERDDFMVDPPKKYFRLTPGGAVRLRGGYIIRHLGHETDGRGRVTRVRCEVIPGTIGQSPPEGVKCRAAIHWVSEGARGAEVRLYDRLFTEERPDKAEGGFKGCLNPSSLEVRVGALVEPRLGDSLPGYSCQFERLGYFVADAKDHDPEGGKLVFNRTVALRDSWAKVRK